MSATELKEKLYRYIDAASNEELERLNAYVEDDPVIGYTFEGEPIRAKAFKEKAKAIRARVKEGHYRTLDELEKESEKW